MRKQLSILCALVLLMQWSFAQTNGPVRLALIAPEAALRPALDLLTVEFSQDGKIILLERAEIERVLREQSLAATSQDFLKLGQVLGADGLLLFEPSQEQTNRFLAIRLVAVKPGVVIESARFGWPIENLSEWAAGIRHHLQLQVSKLNVSRAEAIPLSLVNLRSAIQSTEGRELERQLTFLAVERLSREKQLFILERRRMQVLVEEKEWNSLDDSPFWSGSYLLEGVIDRDGYSAEHLTLDVRLAPPGGVAPIEIAIRERRTNLAAAVDALSWKITEALKLNPNRLGWNPADEAEQFLHDATWAIRWKLFPQAQAASESAWALGKRTPQLASLRLRTYSESCLHRKPMHVGNTDCVTIFAVPDAGKLEPITRALDLFAQGTEFFRTNATDVDWLKLGHRALRTASGTLESFYYAAEARVGQEEALARLRAACRRAADILSRGSGTNSLALDRWSDCLEFSWLKWNEAGIWFERPEDALGMLRETLATGFHPQNLPRLVGWTWEDRKRVPQLQKQFIQDLCAQTNENLRVESKFLAVIRTPSSETVELGKEISDLFARMWEHRDWVFRNKGNASLLRRVEGLFDPEYGKPIPKPQRRDEELTVLRHQLRREYLNRVSTFDSLLFEQLFESAPTPDEARELLPLVESFAQRVAEKPHMTNVIITMFRVSAKLPIARTAVAKPVGSSLPADAAVMGQFISWRLARAGIGSERIPSFSLGQMHNGRLWFLARYFPPQSSFGDYQAAFVQVDLVRGVSQEIPFPAARGFPVAFLVSEENLLTSVADKIERYSFREREWQTLPIAIEGDAEFLELRGRRFVATKETLLELSPDLRSAGVIASSRRQPPKHELDLLWGNRRLQVDGGNRRVQVAGANGKLGLIATNRFWFYDPAGATLTSSPSLPSLAFHYATDVFSWDDGWLVSLTGQLMMPRHLLAFSESATNFDSLLQQQAEFQGRRLGPVLAKQFPPPKWDWPEEFSLETALLAVEARAVWALNPRRFSNDDSPREPDEPLTFADDRNATLFRFEPEFRPPLILRVRLEANAQKIDPFIARQAGFSRRSWVQPNQQTWLPTPEGLVLGAPKVIGHWLIPQSVLEPKLAAQRKALAAGAGRKTASSAAETGPTSTNGAPIKP